MTDVTASELILVTGKDGAVRRLPPEVPLTVGTPDEDGQAITLERLRQLLSQLSPDNGH